MRKCHSPWSTPHPVVWSEPLPCMNWEGAGTKNWGCAGTGAAIPEKANGLHWSDLST